MRPNPSTGLLAGALVAFCVNAQSPAQQTKPSQPDPTDVIRRLESRLDEMDERHRSELQERDEKIAELKTQLDALQAGRKPVPAQTHPAVSAPAFVDRSSADHSAATTDLLGEIDRAGTSTPSVSAAPAGAAPAGTAAVGGAAATSVSDDDTRQQVLRDSAARSSVFDTTSRNPVSFNPDLAVVSDFLGSYSTDHSNNAFNRLDVREVELDLRAAVHPNADAVAVLAFGRDVENPPFPDPSEPPTGPDTSVDVEEAYVFLHDFGVPNLTAKLGRFHLRFGRQNLLHLHDLPTSDPPLVNQAFLAPEALSDSGLSLSYVVPPSVVGNEYVEVVSEVLAGEGASSESPTLRGDLAVDSPAFNNHLLWNHDLGPDWNLELGASWLYGHADADNTHDVNLYGGDVTLIHTDPTGRFFNQLFQAEAIYGDTYDEDGVHRNGWGAYLLGQQQLNRDWFAGIRLDYTQDPSSDHDEAWAINPYVSFYWSEFLRFRVQYQYKAGDVPAENNLFFQATWIFGAHPPHPYWAMR